jgi:hypothetical protein
MVKKRMKMPNRLSYTIIAVVAIIFLSVGVYSLTPGTSPNPGHDISSISPPSPCASGQYLKYVESGGPGYWQCASVSSGTSQWTTSGSSIYYNNGNVGIGATNPVSKLSVGGNGYANMGIYSTGSEYGVYGDSAASGVFGNGITGVTGVGSYAGVIANGGTFDFYAQGAGIDYGTSSSIRWKNNIAEIPNALEKVLNLRGVYFDWDAEHGGEHDIGMIAEEAGEIVPEIVSYEEDGIYASGMDYGALTPLLVEAIKAQQKQIDALEKEIEELKNK